MSSALRPGSPIDTLARDITPFSQIGVTCRTPEAVWTSTVVSPGVRMPWSKANRTRQRMPFPHMSPSEPSELNMIMHRSAPSDGAARMMPSAPTPL